MIKILLTCLTMLASLKAFAICNAGYPEEFIVDYTIACVQDKKHIRADKLDKYCMCLIRGIQRDIPYAKFMSLSDEGILMLPEYQQIRGKCEKEYAKATSKTIPRGKDL